MKPVLEGKKGLPSNALWGFLINGEGKVNRFNTINVNVSDNLSPPKVDQLILKFIKKYNPE